MYFLHKIIFFRVYVPIHTTIVKCPYLVKNGTKYGHFSGRVPLPYQKIGSEKKLLTNQESLESCVLWMFALEFAVGDLTATLIGNSSLVSTNPFRLSSGKSDIG